MNCVKCGGELNSGYICTKCLHDNLPYLKRDNSTSDIKNNKS